MFVVKCQCLHTFILLLPAEVKVKIKVCAKSFHVLRCVVVIFRCKNSIIFTNANKKAGKNEKKSRFAVCRLSLPLPLGGRGQDEKIPYRRKFACVGTEFYARRYGNLAASVRNFTRVLVCQNVQPRRIAGSQLNPNDDVLLKSFFSVVVSPTVVDLLGVVLLLW